MSLRAGIAVVVLTLLMPATAWAATVDEVALALRESGLYVEEGVTLDEGGAREAIAEAGATHGVTLGFVALAEEPGNGSDAYARRVLRAANRDAVLVLTPDSLGYWSSRYDRAARERAADAALPAFRDGDVAAGISAFGAALAQETAVDEPADQEPDFNVNPQPGVGIGDGFPFGVGTLVVLGLLVAAGSALFNASRSTRRLTAVRIDEARTEVRRQIDALAEKILALEPRVTIGPEAAKTSYAAATAAFRDASDGHESAATEADLRVLNDMLDRARWQLDVTTALLDGKEPPAEPGAGIAACFFDPDHGAGVQQATLQTPAGERTVGVCDYCGAKLARGEAPEPRSVVVEGRQVPVGAAPREYGGSGYRDLDVFSVLFGGGGVPYSWGRHHYGRSGWSRGGGGFGMGGFGGGGGGRRSVGGGGGGGRRTFGGGGGGGGRRSLGGGGGGRRKL